MSPPGQTHAAEGAERAEVCVAGDSRFQGVRLEKGAIERGVERISTPHPQKVGS